MNAVAAVTFFLLVGLLVWDEVGRAYDGFAVRSRETELDRIRRLAPLPLLFLFLALCLLILVDVS